MIDFLINIIVGLCVLVAGLFSVTLITCILLWLLDTESASMLFIIIMVLLIAWVIGGSILGN